MNRILKIREPNYKWPVVNRSISLLDRLRKLTMLHRQRKLSRKKISSGAIRVLHRLHKADFSAYLVGGGVRDVLLGLSPKDFDVATNARPEEIRSLFRNSRLIGRRFRLVHVYFKQEIVEVSTFRGNVDEPTKSDDLEDVVIIRPDNTYGTIEEDAWRRDFTVNAIYYDMHKRMITDYTRGMHDLRRRIIRTIGDPKQRFHEDPVRLLRALRLAAKLNFKLHGETAKQVRKLPHLLQHVPRSRLFDEILKLFFEGHAEKTYLVLKQYHYAQALFPQVMEALKRPEFAKYERMLELALQASDQRYLQDKSLNPGFLFAVFLWPVIQQELNQQSAEGKGIFILHHVIDNVLKQQLKILNIPRRLTGMMRSIWVLQYHLERRRLSRIDHVLNHRYFRAAIDFFELRTTAGECDKELSDWWFKLRDANQQQRAQMVEQLNGQISRKSS